MLHHIGPVILYGNKISVNIVLCNDLLSDGTKKLPETMSIYYWRGTLAFNWGQIHRNCTKYPSPQSDWKLPLKNNATSLMGQAVNATFNSTASSSRLWILWTRTVNIINTSSSLILRNNLSSSFWSGRSFTDNSFKNVSTLSGVSAISISKT